jgi:DNA-directed RNA polymerase specialized sigma24 family protein
MVAMTTYTVTAERSGRWWALQCVEVPGALSQVARLDHADQIKEAIAFVAGVDEASVEVALQIVVPDDARTHLERAHQLADEAAAASAGAASESRAAAASLHASGLTVREIGAVMGVSFQRAHQLLKAS